MNGRHRRKRGITVSALQITIMILFGTLGVIMVLGSQLFTRPTGRRRLA